MPLGEQVGKEMPLKQVENIILQIEFISQKSTFLSFSETFDFTGGDFNHLIYNAYIAIDEYFVTYITYMRRIN